MDLQDFEIIFKSECQKNNIKFDYDKSEKLYEYMNLILNWNKKINVTAIVDEKMFIVKHYVDSLLITSLIKETDKVLDIGTGGGFPGIPLKIYHPDAEFTLIDSVNKKIIVVKDVIEKLNLKKIETLHIRAENLGENLKYREMFDVVTTRAVSKLITIVEYMLPFLKVGGKAICMKGPRIEEELKEGKNAIKILGGEIEKVNRLNINDEFERNIVIIRKIKSTDTKYPRGQGKPIKDPIQ